MVSRLLISLVGLAALGGLVYDYLDVRAERALAIESVEQWRAAADALQAERDLWGDMLQAREAENAAARRRLGETLKRLETVSRESKDFLNLRIPADIASGL